MALPLLVQTCPPLPPLSQPLTPALPSRKLPVAAVLVLRFLAMRKMRLGSTPQDLRVLIMLCTLVAAVQMQTCA